MPPPQRRPIPVYAGSWSDRVFAGATDPPFYHSRAADVSRAAPGVAGQPDTRGDDGGRKLAKAIGRQAKCARRADHHARTLPYDIPFRCLLPLEYDNLMMAGRCISGDHIAHASYRVTGDAVATGEAAGLAAAVALHARIAPADINILGLRTRLAAIRSRSQPEIMNSPHP